MRCKNRLKSGHLISLNFSNVAIMRCVDILFITLVEYCGLSAILAPVKSLGTNDKNSLWQHAEWFRLPLQRSVFPAGTYWCDRGTT